MSDYIIIDEKDNVAVVLRPYVKGEKVNGVTLLDDIPQAHKVAMVDIKEEDNIIKYGEAIGHAIVDIKAGSLVHIHNVKTNLDDVSDYKYLPNIPDINTLKKYKNIEVYDRGNNKYGIRNELWIIQLVGCVSGIAHQIIKSFKNEFDIKDIDGVYTFDHPFGCSQMGDDHNMTKIYLQKMVKHPNAGGVLVLGLGCENNQMGAFVDTLGEYNKDRIRTLVCQEVDDEVSMGILLLKELYDKMKDDVRITKPISVLNVGLKCGGSDGMSGITANPLLGRFSDYLILNGGSTVLGEVPEMFGAEHLLMRRAKDRQTFGKVVDLINDFKGYFKKHNQVIYENPSPGNKNGGITTLEDKSLGCTQKSGKTKVVDVVKLGDEIKEQGLNLTSTPGNDLIATTILGCIGCQLVLFTTGRGTPFGGFIPTVKVATNTLMANKKENWIDFNAGVLAEQREMDGVLSDFIDLICDIASVKKYTKNEINDFREISIFKDGVVL